jgi:hypothetical protein
LALAVVVSLACAGGARAQAPDDTKAQRISSPAPSPARTLGSRTSGEDYSHVLPSLGKPTGLVRGPGGVDFDLFHQSAEAENCYGPFSKTTGTAVDTLAFKNPDGSCGPLGGFAHGKEVAATVVGVGPPQLGEPLFVCAFSHMSLILSRFDIRRVTLVRNSRFPCKPDPRPASGRLARST